MEFMQRHSLMQAEPAPSNEFVITAVNSFSQGPKKSDRKKSAPKKESDKPKRPLSAYNLFFQHERAQILKSTPSKYEGDKPRRSHGKIGFAALARTISAKWNNIDLEGRKQFDELAALDKERYKKEMEAWKAQQSLKKSNESLPMSAASDFCGMRIPGFNATSIVKCNLMAASQNNQNGGRMPLNKFRALAHPQMGNAQRLMSQNFFSNNNGNMRSGSASQVVGQALALLEEDMPSFNPVDESYMGHMDEAVNSFRDSPDVAELASKLDDDCLGLLSGLL